MESQRKTCGAKSLLHSWKIEDLTGTEAFVLDLMSQLTLSPDSPCAVANHWKLGFDGAEKFKDLTKSKKNFAKLLQKISLILGFHVKSKKKLKLKILSFYLHQVKVNFKHISAGSSSGR